MRLLSLSGDTSMSPRRFAESTEVPVSKTRAEIEHLLSRHGATSTAVFTSPDRAMIAFEMTGRRVLMKISLPDPSAKDFTRHRRTGALLPAESARARHEAGCRQKWRALFLAVKAKLISVHEGVETFEDAFMAHIVMPDGQTVADLVRPQIASAYAENKMVPLLPYGGK
jgi:hypothetical protein